MIDPVFWLGLSILLVAISLTAVLVVAIPAFQELARAARSVNKLAETLSRELPPTLEAIRLTGLEISELTDEVNDGVKSASEVVKQVDQGLSGARKQADQVGVSGRSVVAGVKAAWQTWKRPTPRNRTPVDRLPPSQKQTIQLGENETISPLRNPSESEDTYIEDYDEHDELKANHPSTSSEDINNDTHSPR